MNKLIAWTSLILAVSLFAEPGENKGQLKKSMKVVPLSSIYLSTEYGGNNHASAVLADGVGIYITQEDEYARAISYLNGKYGDDALKDEKSLKDYVLDNGTVADKELAEKLVVNGPAKSVIGDSCDDGNPQTKNDIYLDENFTCEGKKIYNSAKCEGYSIGSQFEFEGKTYLVVSNSTIVNNLNKAETLCTSNVTDMAYLFFDNRSFNQPIGNWDTSNVTDMSFMFYGAILFNQPIGNWDTSNVKNMTAMFHSVTSFNQSIGDWNTNKVTNMRAMFSNATSFNQPIGNWDTSKVTDMENMFYAANSFNQPIGDWDTSKVTDMSGMFIATPFNQPLNWDTSNVIDMSYMFRDTTLFNQSLNWNTSNVLNMRSMFYNATLFNQNISNWNTGRVSNYLEFAIDSALTSANAPSKNGTKFPTTKP